MTVEVKQLKGSGTVPFGVPFRNVYILNDGGKGWIRINDTLKLDIEKIDRVEGLTIKKLEWNLTSDGNAVFVILSHEKLSTEYITRLMLSRIYSELQKKSSKKKIVFVDASSDTTVPADSSEAITIRPPQGKIWRVMLFEFYVNPPKNASRGQHRLTLYLAYSYNPFFRAYNSYNKYIYVVGNHVFTRHDTEDPDSNVAQILLLSQLKISHDYCLRIIYDNLTDADQANRRTIKLYFEEEDEAP